MSPTLLAAIFLPLAVLALAGGGLVALARKQREHRQHLDARIDELARSLHDRSKALDERCDVLTDALQHQRLCQRIDHLHDLARFARRSGKLKPQAAEAMELYLLDLAAEARQD